VEYERRDVPRIWANPSRISISLEDGTRTFLQQHHYI